MDTFAFFCRKSFATSRLLSENVIITGGLTSRNTYAGYVHYTKSLDKMMQRRDEVNITLGVIERLEFDASDDDDELMAMDIPPSKKSKNN